MLDAMGATTKVAPHIYVKHISMRILIKGGTILTQNQNRDIISGDILIEDSKIKKIGKIWRGAQADKIIDAKNMWVLPGFINSHVHLGESVYAPFMTGKYSLDSYLQKTEGLLPLFGPDEEIRSIIARYSTLNIVRSGTTTIGGGRTDRVSREMGLRNVSGYMLMNSKKLGYLSENFKSSLNKFIEEKDSLTGYSIFAHSLGSINRDVLLGVFECLSRNKKLRLMIHVAEDQRSVDSIVKHWGKREIEILDDYKLLDSRALIVHGNHLTKGELKILRGRGCSVAHCLTSNMGVADRTLDLRTAIDIGLNIAIATDGVVTSSNFSTLKEAGIAHRYHNSFLRNSIIPASTFLDMITVNASKALGLEEETGSLEEGKEADLIIAKPPFENSHTNPVEQLIIYANLVNIREVIIAGKLFIEKGATKIRNCAKIDSDYRKLINSVKEY